MGPAADKPQMIAYLALLTPINDYNHLGTYSVVVVNNKVGYETQWSRMTQ